mmetsp:Transcript_43284/g.126063  ORF Transcript_43284/g.126063 Transcript_43284/m.126063 type:complete len:209 (+) Transcript_43284:690-1316(+)
MTSPLWHRRRGLRWRQHPRRVPRRLLCRRLAQLRRQRSRRRQHPSRFPLLRQRRSRALRPRPRNLLCRAHHLLQRRRRAQRPRRRNRPRRRRLHPRLPRQRRVQRPRRLSRPRQRRNRRHGLRFNRRRLDVRRRTFHRRSQPLLRWHRCRRPRCRRQPPLQLPAQPQSQPQPRPRQRQRRRSYGVRQSAHRIHQLPHFIPRPTMTTTA